VLVRLLYWYCKSKYCYKI